MSNSTLRSSPGTAEHAEGGSATTGVLRSISALMVKATVLCGAVLAGTAALTTEFDEQAKDARLQDATFVDDI